jgi:protein TonB
MTARAHPYLTFPPRRTSAVVAIIGIHMAVIYALVTGLGHRFIERPQPPMNADVLRTTRSEAPPLAPPRVGLLQPPIDLGPIPEIVTGVSPGEDAIHREQAPTVADPTPFQQPPAAVKPVSGGPGKGFPNSDDYYPPAARRLGEQGATAMQVCVDPNGKLTAEPQVARSSGSPRLDEGAIKLAKAGSGHYRATTENGTPVSSCYGFLIKFNLQ